MPAKLFGGWGGNQEIAGVRQRPGRKYRRSLYEKALLDKAHFTGEMVEIDFQHSHRHVLQYCLFLSSVHSSDALTHWLIGALRSKGARFLLSGRRYLVLYTKHDFLPNLG